ncbi:MAG: Hsp20 family protein [Chitinivibrionales bacterium]|nr:Hsp20 family protein [Chitinivibrionales bacterium]
MNANFVNQRFEGPRFTMGKRHNELPLPWSRAGHKEVLKRSKQTRKRFPWASVPEMISKNVGNGKADNEMPAFSGGERDGYVWIAGKIPGVKKKDLNITHAGNTLYIEGTRSARKKIKGLGNQQLETGFSNSVNLTGNLDWENAEAYMGKDFVGVAIPVPREIRKRGRNYGPTVQ